MSFASSVQTEVVLPCEGAIAVQYMSRTGMFRLYDPALGFYREIGAEALICSFQSCALALEEYYALEGAVASNVVDFPGH